MVIETLSTLNQWVEGSLLSNVENYFRANTGKGLTDCATALSIPYEQVAFAMAYVSSGGNLYQFMALPTSDSELESAAALNKYLQP